MFYGDFKDGKRQQFLDAIQIFKKIFSRVYSNDNLITFNRNLTFSRDQEFMVAFSECAQTEQEKSLIWRLHTLTWAARQCQYLEGDFVECGVFKGFSMSVIEKLIDFKAVDKKLYLYDTYEGIPEEYNSENRSNIVYDREVDLCQQVSEKFSHNPCVNVVKGVVPTIFAETCPDKIAFLHIDMNSSKSEIEALHVLFDKVVSRGIIVFDDFGWLGYDKQTWAEIDFMKERNHTVLELPTGQGVVVKR